MALDASPAWVMAHFAVTLRDAGLRSVAAEGCYVGRAVPASPRPRQPGDLAGRLALYRRHARQAARAADTVGAVIRARVSTLRDLGRLRACVAHAAQVVDGIAIVLGNHPLDMQDDPASMTALKAGVGGDLSSYDAEMLRACSDGDAAQVARAVGNWGYHVARLAGTDTPVRCKVYEGQVPDAPTEYALGEAALHDLLRSRIGSIGSTLQWILALQYDELIEPEATRAVLHRLTTHPNPLVCAYDVAEVTHWETTRLCREDPPWGDGGKWTGGPSRVALYRAGCGPDRPGFGLASQRVANLRLRRLSWMTDADRARMKVARASEGMRMAEYRTETRLGLHMLVYERENPEDVARWLDEAHGLVDVVVLVWTGDPANVPSELKEIVEFHDARLLFVRLDHDLAAVRNAGIDELARAGLRWAWFVDPDEWWRDPLGDARAMRRACESTRWGWLQNVANYSADGSPPTISDSIRMSRIDPSRPMRMSGRVHEGFGDFLDAMVRAGEHPRVIYFPFVLQHRGMALGETRTREKLDHYERLLRLELQDRPHNPGAWVSLAWHYDNDGHPDLAAECLSRAVACAGRSYLPHKEQGMRYLRLARDEFLACVKNLSTSHAYTAHAERILAWLQEQAPPPVRRTPSHQSSSPAELPAFPPLVGYDDTRGAL
ncbi:MAG: hypothetical protein KGS10_05515 [Chloroflexi bacterium]|nr:hypothetical protein [Chloroflexota bacterium]